MTTSILEGKAQDFDVDDIEYLRHGDKPLLARVHKPRGEGPFPALVECHGGGRWLPGRPTAKVGHHGLVPPGPTYREVAPPGHGLTRGRVDRARFPLGQRGAVSGLSAGHQLCGAL